MASRQPRPPARRILPPVALTGALSLVVAGGIVAPAGAQTPGANGTVEVLAFNDFHGRLVQDGESAGAAILAGAADELGGANTALVSAGDNIGASTFVSAVQQDAPTIEALNAMGLDASAVGNHEFDQGADDLVGRVSDLADFPYLAANVQGTGFGTGQTVEPYEIWTAENGITVGFIGVVTPTVPSLVTPAGITGYNFGDMAQAANSYAAQLSDGNDANGEADVVVVLAHDGAASTAEAALNDGSDFAKLVQSANDDVDAIVSGHTHLLYAHNVGGMPVTSAAQYGEALTNLTFTVANGEVTAATAENIDLGEEVEEGEETVFRTDFAPNAEVAAIVEAAAERAEVEGARKLGTITADLNRAKNTNGEENRGGESTAGNFIADVQLWATRDNGSQIAFMNPGGIRRDITYAGEGGDGVVTYKEAAESQPFANTLVTMNLTGAQIVQVLEEQWQPAGASRPFLKLGVSKGFEYTYDPTAPAGERIETVTLDGAPLVATQSYKVTVNSFLASGGDNFTTLAQGTNKADSGRVDLQAVVDYFAANPTVTPDNAQRAVGVDVEGSVAPGARVTLNLSSLDFSTTEPNATTVTVAMNGQTLGTATINGAIVDTTDEVGRATLTVTLPATLGDGELVITTDQGTEVVHALTSDGAAPTGPVGFFLNDGWDTVAEHEFMFGRFTDEVLIGDFDGDGQDSITVRRGSTFYVSNAPKGGPADAVFTYGRPGDTVLVGDWDGDGVDSLAVRRGNVYHVKNTLTGGPADQVLVYGRPADAVVVGDWDGDATDTFAVRRGASYFVKNTITGGPADTVVVYGRAGDVTLAGDWDGDGTDTFAVRRGAQYFVKNSITPGAADIHVVYGRAGDEVFVGDWNGDDTDTLGVRRHP